jgi:O-antigen/teichoic acid export membrane protein
LTIVPWRIFDFQILCVGGIAVSLQGLYYFAVASKGKSKSLLVWTIIKRGIGLLVVLLGMYFGGINGLLWGSAAVAWIILFSNAYLVRKYINYTFLEQIRDLFPIVLLSICIFILLFIVNSFFTGNLYFKAFIIFLLYIVLYIGISFFTKIKALFSLLEILRNFKNKN